MIRRSHPLFSTLVARIHYHTAKMPRRNTSRTDDQYSELEKDRRSEERDFQRYATSYGVYDAATKIYTPQTYEQSVASFAADIQRALDAGCLDSCECLGGCGECAVPAKKSAKSLREIQAEELTAASASAASAASATPAPKDRAAAEKAAAEAAWEADRAAHDAAGRKPCWVCQRYADETHYHAPKRGHCALASQLFYVFDRWDQPHTAYVRREEMAAFQERKHYQAASAAAEAAAAAKKAELGTLIDAALTATASTAPTKKGAKAKKATVEKFSLDDL